MDFFVDEQSEGWERIFLIVFRGFSLSVDMLSKLHVKIHQYPEFVHHVAQY